MRKRIMFLNVSLLLASYLSAWEAIPMRDAPIARKESVILKVIITGDHFVKKYADDSAPNITLTATPTILGGTYLWSIVQGSDKVAFVGGTAAATVTIKGETPSVANGDVQITVSYTMDNATAENTHALTVQKPTTIEHGELTFILNQVIRLGIPISFAVGAKKYIGTLYDQLSNTMKDVPFTETVSIDKQNSIPNSGYITFVNTGSGTTNDKGQYSDVYALPVWGQVPDDMNIKVNQSVFFGGYKGINNITLTKTSVTDSYPITLSTP